MTKRTGRGLSESAFTKWFCDRLEKVNAYILVLAGESQFQQSGLPDRYVCHTRWRGWIEFKKASNKLRPNQLLVCHKLLDRGDMVIVIRYINDSHLGTIMFETVPYSDKGAKEVAMLDCIKLQQLGDPGAGLKILETLELYYT